MSEVDFETEYGQFHRYEMFSKEGNNACEALVAAIEEIAKGAFWDKKPLSREFLIAQIREGQEEIRKTHAEVGDTEPRCEIAYQINKRVFKPLSLEEFDRFEI